MKIVSTYREAHLAHLARGRLEAHGIQAVVSDEHLVNTNWVLSNAVGGVKVQVSDGDLAQALEVLNVAAEHEGECCPECGSQSVSRRYSTWSLLPSLAFQLPVFFGRRWSCADCGGRW